MDDHKYKEGQVVYEKGNTADKLTVRRYVHRIYYCKVTDNPTQKERAFFERELTNEA